MTHEQAKSELMQIYMSLSEEKKKAIDVLLSESEKPNKSEVLQNTQQFADGEYISKTELLKAIDTWDKFGVDDTNSLFRLDNLSLPHYVPYIHYDDVVKCIKGLPSVDIPQDNDGCENCRWQSLSESEMPCRQCMHNYTDEWEKEKPTDTITMTQQETKTGHWKRISMDRYTTHAQYWYECDKCGKHNLGNTDYCPNCGADMRGDDNENSDN